jgi:TonB family protein
MTPVADIAPPSPRPRPREKEVASVPAVVPEAATRQRQGGQNGAGAHQAFNKKVYRLLTSLARAAYPKRALRRRQEGVIPVRLVLGADGEIESHQILDGAEAPRVLIEAAAELLAAAAPEIAKLAREHGIEAGSARFNVRYKIAKSSR